MRLIVGLGNPGEKYLHTRHNVGFMVLEKIAKEKEVAFRTEEHWESRLADMGELNDKTKLVEPQTFMNESGRAVRSVKDYWKVDVVNIWVIHDDVDLEKGVIRVSYGGSSAGHKGVNSIIDNIGEKFWRIRVGVGKREGIATEDWVLMNLSHEEMIDFELIIDKTVEIVLDFLSIHKIEEQTFNVGA